VSDITSNSSANYVLLTRLADEFAARYRAGERPSLQEYIDRYPELADEIHELFPAMVEIEQVKGDHEEAAEKTAAPPPFARRQLGDFRIIRQVGKGGMGIVYEAEQVSLGRHVALKVLPKSMLVDANAKRRFKREAKSAAKLHHTNIVPVFGVGDQHGMPYYMMQFIQGLGLDEVLEELKRLQTANVRPGTFLEGELRVLRNVGQLSNPSAEERHVETLTKGALSAAKVARSLLTGEFRSPLDQDDEPTAPVTVEGACKEQEGADAPRSPALSDSFTPSSPSVVLPGRSRDGSKSRHRKQTYWQSVASIGAQVANALEYAHKQGVQHRDIKPSNLLLDTQATVWVTDFGLAKADDQQNLTHTGDILGTLRYMPPEAFEGKTDARSDVYSLGLTLYELLAFRPAFDEKDRNRLIKQVTHEEPARLSKLNRQVPRDLETIVHKAIDKDPKQRYGSAGALAEDLQRFIEDEPINARRASHTERLWRWCRRNPLMAGLASAVFWLLAATAVVGSVGYAQTRLALCREAAEHAKVDRQGAEAQRRRARAENNLYHSLVREAQAIRRLRDAGYRREVWDRLKQALALDTPDKDPAELRQEAVACLGDSVGLAPTTWTNFTTNISALEVHPDSRQVAIGLEGGDLLLRDLATGGETARLREHRAPVVRLSFDATGNRMASGDLGGVVKVWRAHFGATWVCTRTIAIDRPDAGNYAPEHWHESVLVVLTSNGKSLLTCSSAKPLVALWDLADGTRTKTFQAPAPGTLSGLALSPDGKLLAAGYNRNRILVWEVANPALVRNIASDTGWIFDLAFSNSGNYLGYAGAQGGAVLVGSEFQRLNFARFGISPSVRFSPDNKVVAFADPQGGVIRLWEIATNREVAVLNSPGSGVVRFSTDGKTLLADADRRNTVRIWNVAAAREKFVVGAHIGGVPSVAFSPDGRRLASAGKDRTVRIWDPAAGRLIHELNGFRAELETVAFSPDGSILATGDYASGIRFWQTTSWQELPPPKHPLGPQIWACAFSPDGGHFAACGQRGIVLWKVVASPAHGRPDSELLLQQVARPSDRAITSLGFSSDGSLLAWTPYDGWRLHLWDVSNARPYPFPPLNVNGFVRNMAFYRNGKHLAFIRGGGVPEVWNAVTRQQVYPSGPDDFHDARGEARKLWLTCVVALSTDDAWFAAQGARGSVTVWDMHKRELLLALPEEHGFNWGLAWSPNRELLAASFSDGSLVLWNIPKIRAQLAEIGLDWQDPPLPAEGLQPAGTTSGPAPVETARLFALELFGTAQATLATEGNVCRVDVTAVDGTNWHARITKLFDDPQARATYTVRFRARADTPRGIFLGGFIDEPDRHGIGLSQHVSLTEEWQDYQYEFQAKDLAAENVIHFILGDQVGTVWIADFSLAKVAK